MQSTKAGVYEIVNVANCKKYVGSSKNVHLRLIQHRSLLKKGKHYNQHLQASFNKYNEKAFIFRPMFFCNEADLIEKEQEIVKDCNYMDRNFGFNIREPNMASMAEETIAKIKISTIGVNTWAKGVKRPAWSVEKCAAGHRGLKRSDTSKKRYSESKTGAKNSMVKLTEAQVLKIIELRKLEAVTYKELATMFNVSFSAIANIFNGHTWTYLTNKK